MGGTAAEQVDLVASLPHHLPVGARIALVAMLLIVTWMTRSIAMAVESIILSLLSLGATLGLIVLVFQRGFLDGLIGIVSTGTVDAKQMILIFAVALGLSMDYNLFMLGRIQEEWVSGRTTPVATGLSKTGWLIASAALLLAVVVGAFMGAQLTILKQIGFGLAFAVLVDAFVVRTLLMPATLELLGRFAWWPGDCLQYSGPKKPDMR